MLFDVDWRSDVHQLTDGRYLLRIGDKNMPFPAQDIAALKEGKRRRVTEARFVAEASLADLEPELVAALADRVLIAYGAPGGQIAALAARMNAWRVPGMMLDNPTVP